MEEQDYPENHTANLKNRTGLFQRGRTSGFTFEQRFAMLAKAGLG